MNYKYFSKEDLSLFQLFDKKISKDFLKFRKPSNKQSNLNTYISNKNKSILLVLDRGKIIGYQAFSINGKKARLIGAGILREYRRKGIAKSLVNSALNQMKKRKVKRVISRTWESNLASRALLEGSGFKKYKVVKRDRINGEDSIWFKLDLH
jgi:RimJ/RimL family protein N-acetyltransferase